MIKRFYILLLAIVASVGMMNAKVTWSSSNISNLTVNGNSYSKEGVTLGPNASNNYAYWLDYGDESQNGIAFYANATGGHTFSNSLGKNFTKIEMTLNGSTGWNVAYLGSGWNIDGMKVIWTGNASTVDLLTETSDFGGAATVKSIVFYFEGDSEEPGGGSTDVILCTAADLGKVLCTDGSIYATVSDATAASKTAVAMIAYIDTENNKGLALALADESGTMEWATAKTTAAAHTPAVSGGTWTLASKDDWNNMITAAGDYTALRDGFSGVGGTNMQQAAYWSSTPENANAWRYYFTYGGMWTDGYVDNPCYVRACLTFDISAAPAYETVMNLINEIPNPVELTAECKAKIDAARTAYNALSDADKALVTNLATLEAAEQAYADAKQAADQAVADPVIAQINALPTTIKLPTYDLMVAAREAYDALTADQKALVPAATLTKLTDLEAAFAAIGGGGGAPTVVVIYKSEFTSTGVTKEGVNLALSNGSMTAGDPLAMDGSFEFSTSLGKFTGITIETDINIMNISEGAYTSAGWPTGTNLGTSAAWTGNSESVLISCMVAGNAITITCTVAPASVIDDAKAALALINAIPDPVSLEDACVKAIKDARAAVDALGENASLIDAADMAKLTDAEAALTALNQAEADEVLAKINNIPTPVELKLATRDSIESARAAYDALNAAQQALVRHL